MILVYFVFCLFCIFIECDDLQSIGFMLSNGLTVVLSLCYKFKSYA